ncbi:glycosyltransferase WbuB [Methylomonas rosea]|uniref:Glycosyltransferase WbuB n=1 Tax=Methylomonas rosea TaxID=2952227 RepID=A0ABT1TZD9_9GAMM|nr:glycosyltransferase WbuB [Methylomonas sp. WSC-7]MCQ8119761.1 glycosyltransferase WbuB [Methylomonas sp. WSC-7]
MKILLYGLNYAPELTGIGKYSGEMCEWLAANGHDIRVVCAPPYYPEWRIGSGYGSWQYRTEIIGGVRVYRCPLFVPKQPVTLTRLLHLVSFACSSFPLIFRQWAWKPDAVICIEPTFFCVPGALLFSKLRGSRSMLHIQDFELDAMLGLGMGKAGWTARLAKTIERWCMRRFDIVSSISYSMLHNAEQKIDGNEKLFYFPNWVDTDFLTPSGNPSLFRLRWNILNTTRVVLYSGNMGKKQGLEIVLRAAKELESQPNLLFVMVGAGAAQSELMQLADQLQLSNLKFFPLQSYQELPDLMALADIHLVVQKKGAADAVLPSKLTAILAVGGNCVLTAEANTELGLLCEKYPGIAKRIEPENAEVLAESLSSMLSSLPPIKSGIYNKVARQFALDNLRKDRILSRLVEKLAD